MTQTTIFNKEELSSPAYKTAVALIKAYVLRGDSIASLKSGQLGMWASKGHASIGGYLNGKRYSTDKIIVEVDTDGKEVEEIFDLKKVYNDIKESHYGRQVL